MTYLGWQQHTPAVLPRITPPEYITDIQTGLFGSLLLSPLIILISFYYHSKHLTDIAIAAS